MTTSVSEPATHAAGPSSWSYRRPVIGLALTSLMLVLIQALLVHALCGLCLASAAISFVNAGLGYPEVLATLQTRRHA